MRYKMNTKLKNRIKNMTFQTQQERRVQVEKLETDKYYEELYRKRTMELLGNTNEDIYRITRGSIRSQYI